MAADRVRALVDARWAEIDKVVSTALKTDATKDLEAIFPVEPGEADEFVRIIGLERKKVGDGPIHEFHPDYSVPIELEWSSFMRFDQLRDGDLVGLQTFAASARANERDTLLRRFVERMPATKISDLPAALEALPQNTLVTAVVVGSKTNQDTAKQQLASKFVMTAVVLFDNDSLIPGAIIVRHPRPRVIRHSDLALGWAATTVEGVAGVEFTLTGRYRILDLPEPPTPAATTPAATAPAATAPAATAPAATAPAATAPAPPA